MGVLADAADAGHGVKLPLVQKRDDLGPGRHLLFAEIVIVLRAQVFLRRLLRRTENLTENWADVDSGIVDLFLHRLHAQPPATQAAPREPRVNIGVQGFH